MARVANWAVLGLVSFAVSACATVPPSGHADGRCAPRKGMTTDELVRCGCVAAHSDASAIVSRKGARGAEASEVVVIVPYVCPLGKAGIARVSVNNGVVDEVME